MSKYFHLLENVGKCSNTFENIKNPDFYVVLCISSIIHILYFLYFCNFCNFGIYIFCIFCIFYIFCILHPIKNQTPAGMGYAQKMHLAANMIRYTWSERICMAIVLRRPSSVGPDVAISRETNGKGRRCRCHNVHV